MQYSCLYGRLVQQRFPGVSPATFSIGLYMELDELCVLQLDHILRLRPQTAQQDEVGSDSNGAGRDEVTFH